MKAINLLPPDAALRAAARRRRFAFVLLGIMYLALLGAGFFYFKGQQTEVEDLLADQQNTNQGLQADIDALAPAAQLEAEFRAGATQIESILATDIAFGRLLNDLGRMIPDRVWLDSFTASAQIDIDNPLAVGLVTMNGTAFDYPDAASWLRTLDSDRWPAVDVGWVLSTSQSDVAEVPVVSFTSVGVLTQASLDDRVSRRVPTVPG